MAMDEVVVAGVMSQGHKRSTNTDPPSFPGTKLKQRVSYAVLCRSVDVGGRGDPHLGACAVVGKEAGGLRLIWMGPLPVAVSGQFWKQLPA